MPISITCPGCSQVCQVADEHAGMQVQCPICKKVITVPGLPTAVPVAAAVAEGPPPAGSPPYPPSRPSYVPAPGASPFAMIDAMFPGNTLARPLFFAGIGCLGVMMLSTFLPWWSIPAVEFLNVRVGGSLLGIQLPGGILTFSWFYFTENELSPGAARVGNYKALFNLRGDNGQSTGGLAVDTNLGWKGAEKYVATVPQVFDLWQVNQDAEYHEAGKPGEQAGATGLRLVPTRVESVPVAGRE